MRNIFLEKSYAKCGRETIPRPFSKKRKLSIYLDQSLKVLYSLLLLYAKLRNILKISWRSLAFASYKAFLKKQKEVRKYSPYLNFCMNFEEKYFFWLHFIKGPNFIFWLPLLREILGNTCIVIV